MQGKDIANKGAAPGAPADCSSGSSSPNHRLHTKRYDFVLSAPLTSYTCHQGACRSQKVIGNGSMDSYVCRLIQRPRQLIKREQILLPIFVLQRVEEAFRSIFRVSDNKENKLY